ncbi:MAG: VCBS repeat-containing protein [Candidatus Wallbacteria bacterium]|nr:VCBS repeat-containing protein [Candidatus Wallbacteria bacterium]
MRLRIITALLVLLNAGLLWAEPAVHPDYEYQAIDQNPEKPAFVSIADLDGDGKKELIVSAFSGSSPVGSGHLTIYIRIGASLSAWQSRILAGSEKIKFPNSVTVFDVDGDGDPNIYLLEQTGLGKFSTKVLLTDMPQGGVAAADLDGDGRDEIVVSSYEKNRLGILKKR